MFHAAQLLSSPVDASLTSIQGDSSSGNAGTLLFIIIVVVVIAFLVSGGGETVVVVQKGSSFLGFLTFIAVVGFVLLLAASRTSGIS